MLKSRVVEVLGEKNLLLPHLLEEALIANARAKYLFALLQAAQAHAEQPERAVVDLRAERRAAQIDDARYDEIVAASQSLGHGSYAVPMAARIHGELLAAIDAMIRPLAAAGDGETVTAASASRRRAALGIVAPEADRIDRAYLASVTAAPKHGDSMHRLVMDLHKALNRLEARIAVRSIDGAAVYDIRERDEVLIAAFMRGLNATAPLKLDHPGLGTTATRRGETLVIQNDIGTTDAHVIIVEVEGLATTVSYTDVHRKRARFFRSLFDPWNVSWSDTETTRAAGLANEADFYLLRGHHEARSHDELLRYLAFLGSRIVFLIDWNRARKRLRHFVGAAESIDILRWAANEEVGHRGFLQAGGETFLFTVIEAAGRGSIRYGQRLDEVLGAEAASEFLRFVLRTSSEALRAGRSRRLLRDEIETELRRIFLSAEERALAIVCDHAALVGDIAAVVRDGVQELGAGDRGRAARRAKRWETRADGLLNRLREMSRTTPGARPYRDVTEVADDGADNLEEAAFLLSLAVAPPPPELLDALGRLAAAALEAAREFVKTVECAAFAQRGAAREHVHDFLEAVDRTTELEHTTDELEREVMAGLARADGGRIWVYHSVASAIEESADALSRSALMLRDHLLGEVPR